VFFIQKKYSEEVEKNNKHKNKEPSIARMTVLGLMATFTPTRWLLRMHKRKVEDSSTTEEVDSPMEQIPVFYVHGFRGGDYTTNKMVQAACEAKGTDKFLKATIDPFGNFILEGTWTADKQPIVQLIFKDRIAGVYASSYYLRAALSYLSKRYHFKKYSAVAHSLGAPSVIKAEMKTSLRKNFPHLDHCALIAGPFDGVMYLGDLPNVNRLNEKGRPILMSLSYMGMLFNQRRFNPNISVLNIYGNILDETNTDRFISVVSAKSIRYILAPVAHTFQEVEVRGDAAEHSVLHDNPFVINIINKFLKLSD